MRRLANIDTANTGDELSTMIKNFAWTTAFAALLSAPTAALALWDVQSSEEDVFGNINVTATSIGDNGSIVRFECGTGKDPFVALLIKDNSGDIPAIPAMLLMKAEDGSLVTAVAELSSWNEDYAAIVTSDVIFLDALAEAMLSAKKSIPIGGEVADVGLKISDTFSSSGSTAAGAAVKKGCLTGSESN